MAQHSEGESVDMRLKPGRLPSKNISIEDSDFQVVEPQAGVAGDVIEWQVPGSSAGLIDLANSFIISTMTATKTGAAAIDADDVIHLVQGVGFMQWKDLQLYLNGVDVSDNKSAAYGIATFYDRALQKPQGYGSGKLYPNIMHTSLDKVRRAAATDVAHLAADFLVHSCPGDAEGLVLADCFPNGRLVDEYGGAATAFSGENDGNMLRGSNYARGWMIRADNEFDIKTQLDIGMAKTPYYLPSNVDVRLVGTKAGNAMLLQGAIGATGTDAAVTYTSARLYLRRVYPTQSASQMLAESILAAPFSYPIVRQRAAVRNVATGTTNYSATGLFNGVRPDLVIVAFGGQAPTQGHYQYSPVATSWVQRHPHNTGADMDIPVVTACSLMVGSKQFPRRQFEQTVTVASGKHECIRAYEAYKNACANDDAPLISYQEFTNSYTFFTFNLRPDGAAPGESATDLTARESVEIRATFQSATQQPCSCIAVAWSHATVSIDASRNVSRIGF